MAKPNGFHPDLTSGQTVRLRNAAAPRAKRSNPRRREDVLQRQVVDWLREHLVQGEIVHVRNESRSKMDNVRGRMMGVNKGAPDLLVFLPGGQTAGIELKAPKGRNGERPGYQSADQKDFQQRFEALGFSYCMCRSIKEVRAFLEGEGAQLLPELSARARKGEGNGR